MKIDFTKRSVTRRNILQLENIKEYPFSDLIRNHARRVFAGQLDPNPCPSPPQQSCAEPRTAYPSPTSPNSKQLLFSQVMFEVLILIDRQAVFVT